MVKIHLGTKIEQKLSALNKNWLKLLILLKKKKKKIAENTDKRKKKDVI